MARVLAPAFRAGLRTARVCGWRGLLLALVSYVPLALSFAVLGGALVFAGLALHVVVLLALVRLLGASRGVPLPPLPQTDENGNRVLAPARPGPPLTGADRSPLVALRHAVALWRPAVAISGLYLLAQVGAVLTVVALSGGRVVDYSPTAQLIAVLPISALFLAFVFLATQRVALEGDPRVLVAAAHSVRIARAAYGPLLLLTAAEPVIAALGAVAMPEEHPPVTHVVVVTALTVLVATVVKVVVTAVANELYLAGPRLDLPVAEPPG